MSTVLVSGRVDEDVKQRTDLVLRKAGKTNSDVIRSLWNSIAATGEIPVFETGASQKKPSVVDRMKALREKTPESDFIRDLTPERLKEVLSSRDQNLS